ncbi:MAG: mechanosensitive ion channel family protein [Phycisphaerales bacterium]
MHTRILSLILLAIVAMTSLAQSDSSDLQTLVVQLEELLEDVDGLQRHDVTLDNQTIVISGVAHDSNTLGSINQLLSDRLEQGQYRNEVSLSLDFEDQIEGAASRVNDRLDRIIGYLPLLPIAIVAIGIAFFIAWIVGKLDSIFASFIQNPFLQGITQRAVQLAILLIGVLIALDILDAIALIGGVLGAAGIFGLAIGFAFRDLVENYIASILLSLRQPFRPKDHVIIDGHEGLVTSMNTRTTVLTTFDGNIVRIPNAVVFKTTLTNYSTDQRRRFSFTVGIGYDVDLHLAISTGIDIVLSTEGVLEDPEPTGVITELGDSSITLQLFGWVDQKNHSFPKVRSFAMQRVKSKFDELDIDMPEPIYKIRVDSSQFQESLQSSSSEAVEQREKLDSEQVAPQSIEPDRAVEVMAESEINESQNLLDQHGPAE